jgi:prophage DNA circulation protein
MVDWSSRLWPASYKGVPFRVEQDQATSGRRLAIHEFPGRDEPFVEDLGASARKVEITAYLASDALDVEAAALEAVARSGGAGVLVLPMAGPVMVHCQECRREQSRDKQGYSAFSVTFVRDGAASPLASVALLAQLAFDGAGALGDAAGLIVSAIEVVGQAGSVVDDAISGARDVAAVFDAVRESNAVDPTVSGEVRNLLADLYDEAPTLISRQTGAAASFGTRMVEAVRLLGDGMQPDDAATAFGALADLEPVPPPAYTLAPTPAVRARNAARLDRLARLAALAAWSDALMRRSYGSRRDGVAARADAATRFGIALADLPGAENLEAYAAAAALRGQVAAYLSRLITDLAPVVTVTAPLRMPSLWWGWRLYGDPTRGAEIVARNGVRHPAHIPTEFEALAQ